MGMVDTEEKEVLMVMENEVTKDDKAKEVMLINEENLQDRIYVIRGQKVMLDFELAEIYGYTTKSFNRQVKNNIEKFEGKDFMFQLTKCEWDDLRCKNCTSSWGGSRYRPLILK